jgi:DNA-binding NtrC family response regulator
VILDGTGRTVLIVDDDELFCDAMQDYLGSKNIQVFTAYTGKDGLAACSQNSVDVVLLDQKLPDAEGHTLCPGILGHNDRTKIIFITAQPSFDVAVKAIRAGAYDYLSKPLELEELTLAINKAFRTTDLERRAQIEDYKNLKESEEAVLVGGNRGLAEVAKLVDLAASVESPVLITGETGTGKNVVAKSIHYKSSARKEAFITINCSALPEHLIEAELFGYEKGAFTGASTSKKGIFEMAEGGTLFLDEIGEMPVHLQTKLLGALEDKQIKRLGSESIRPVDVRIIAATSTDLQEALDVTFRKDLYFRLSVIRIHIPPLRERPEDIPELCDYLLNKVVSGLYAELPDSELKKLMEYDWPGNVRELKNILERASILHRGQTIRPSELLDSPAGGRVGNRELGATADAVSLMEVEKGHIKLMLEEHSGNLTRTAKSLGIALSTLKRKIKAYGLK